MGRLLGTMPSDVTKEVVERFPFFDGGMRRRLFSGVIVAAALGTFFDVELLNRSVSLDRLLDSWLVGIFLLLVIFVLGSVVELVSSIFIKRAMAAVVWTLRAPLELCATENPALKVVFAVLIYALVLPSLFWVAIAAGIFGHRFSVRAKLEGEAESVVETLPGFIGRAFREPFSESLDPAWRKYSEHLSPEARRSITRKFALTEDVAAFFAALIGVIGLYLASGSGRFIFAARETGRTSTSSAAGESEAASPNQVGPADVDTGLPVPTVQVDPDVTSYIFALIAILSVSAIVYFISVRSALQTCVDLANAEAEEVETAKPGTPVAVPVARSGE